MKTLLLAGWSGLAFLSSAIGTASSAAAQGGIQPRDAAAMFGAREGIEDISLSPDGKSVAFLVPQAGQGNALYTLPVGTTEPRRILVASGEPEQLSGCSWVSNRRLLCNVQILRKDVVPTVMTRMVALDSDGANLNVVSRREGANALGWTNFGGEVIDWLPGEEDSVLMGRVYIPEARIGTNISSNLKGYAVDRVNTRTLDSKRIERPHPEAIDYIADGRGKVRIMGTLDRTESGYARNAITYFYRKPDSDAWESLGHYHVLTGGGFDPVGVDHVSNVAYGFRRTGGRTGLVQVALDGSLAETALYSHPQVDVEGVIRLGRNRRLVGVTYVLEKREASYFDPEVKRLTQALGKALPKTPLIRIMDSSEDESSLLLWSGSDVDPGRFYVFDKATKQLRQLVLSRPELDGVALAPVKPVSYRASDGTMIPGYLTLPPGSSGKGLPAIVLPHGGPAARDEWGFDWLAQFYAHKGYAVLQPNFRGSSGYGNAWFQKNGFQSWRTAIGDVIDGGRWLLSEGIASPQKLGIVGWSYGGYAALQSAAVAPGLFKGVVAIAPVTDLEKLRDDAMDYSNGLQVKAYIGAGPHLREGSPAQNAKAIASPVMLFHGTLDLNVPIGQSKLMNDRLGDAGKKRELVIYPGLDHGLNDSAARSDLLRRSDQFLREALGLR